MPTIRITQNLLDNQDITQLTYNGNPVAIGTVTPTVTTVSVNTSCSLGVIYQADASGGSITLTLPTAIGVAGQSIAITRIDDSANSLVVATTGGQTINGQTTTSIAFQRSYFTFTSNGSNWIIN